MMHELQLAVRVAAAVLLVLLVACINAANLLLARIAAREREFAVRRALGASRPRLMRQVIIESLVLSPLAGAASIPPAIWTIQAIRLLIPPTLHGINDLALNSRVLAATGVISLATAILFGLAPSFSIRGKSTADVLRGASGSAASSEGGRSRPRRRSRPGHLAGYVVIAVSSCCSGPAQHCR